MVQKQASDRGGRQTQEPSSSRAAAGGLQPKSLVKKEVLTAGLEPATVGTYAADQCSDPRPIL